MTCQITTVSGGGVDCVEDFETVLAKIKAATVSGVSRSIIVTEYVTSRAKNRRVLVRVDNITTVREGLG